MAAPLPLSGIRIVDFTEVWAGPMGCSFLADMGAEVIKVESFPRASMTRTVTATPLRRGFTAGDDHIWERSATHNMANRNKFACTLNLGHPRGLELFKKLVSISDAVVEGYSAGTAQRLGVAYSDLVKVKPDLVMISLPAWGVEGHYQGYVTIGSGIDATSGHWSLRGYPGDDPSETMGVVHTDAIAAVSLGFALLTALHYRERTGKGQWIDMAQAEAFLNHLSRPLMDYAMNRRVWRPLGNGDTSMAPHGVYRCTGEDSWVAITVTSDAEWLALRQVMGDPEWARDERFADVVGRWRNQDDLDCHIEEWTCQRDAYTVMQLLQSAGVPATPVLDESGVFADPHIAARGFFEPVTHLLNGTRLHPGMPWRLSRTPTHIRIPPNMVGEHNRYVLVDLLGVPEDELTVLEAEQVIGYGYAPGADVDQRVRVRTSPTS